MKVLVLGKATERSETGEFGTPEEFAAMDRFNQELVEAIMTDDGGPAQAGDGHAVATQRSERTESEWSQPRISS